MKRRFAWALPAIFALSAVAGALSAHADIAATLNQAESVVVTDLIQLVDSVLFTQSEPIALTETDSAVLAAQTNDGEPITLSEAENFGLAAQLTVFEAIKVTDTIPDATPPTVSLTSKPANPTTSTQASFSWTIADPDNTSGFSSFCKLDSASFAACISGISFTQLGDGLHTFTVRAADLAGNLSADVSYSWLVDTTPPTIHCDQPDVAWHASDVTLKCTASDSGSGLANPSDASFTLSTSVPVGTETANASTGSHQVCDVLNNCATAGPISGIKVDKKAPAISASAVTTGDGMPYAPGTWTNQSVRVSFTCTDGGSGVDPSTITAPVTLTADGKDQSATGHCSDLVGNSASTSFTNIDIDKTPPTIVYQGQSPAANSSGWNNTSVTLNWTCSDALSGPVAASVSVTIATEGTNQSGTGTCVDHAGNSASNTQSGINIDKTAPILAASAKTADGKPYTSGTWTSQNVTVTFTCTDDRSGVASVTPPITVTTEGFNQSVTGNCSDNAGNAASPLTFGGIDIDRTPPTTTFTSSPGPLDGRQLVTVSAEVDINESPVSFSATCYDSFGINAVLSATDNVSGVASIRYGFAKVMPGEPLPNPGLDSTINGGSGTVSFLTGGVYVLNFAAVDVAGNREATQTRWIFVNDKHGVACASAPVPVSSLPASGTAMMRGKIETDQLHLPINFTFHYQTRP